mmetsp:Transcript_13803/g.35129  ORF Transcript_13803/g.35129 Transcript_13803/m.35129 type:complete len:209 (+) Transcript_13803:747-1373(+)
MARQGARTLLRRRTRLHQEVGPQRGQGGHWAERAHGWRAGRSQRFHKRPLHLPRPECGPPHLREQRPHCAAVAAQHGQGDARALPPLRQRPRARRAARLQAGGHGRERALRVSLLSHRPHAPHAPLLLHLLLGLRARRARLPARGGWRRLRGADQRRRDGRDKGLGCPEQQRAAAEHQAARACDADARGRELLRDDARGLQSLLRGGQ